MHKKTFHVFHVSFIEKNFLRGFEEKRKDSYLDDLFNVKGTFNVEIACFVSIFLKKILLHS